MKRVTFACVVYEKMRLNDGRYPIKLRVTYNAKSTLIGTSLYARKEDLTYKGKLKDGSLKRQTEDLVRQFQDAAQKFNPTLFPDWTVTEVYDYVKKVIQMDNFRLDFTEYAEKFITKKKLTSHQSSLNYKAALSALQAFLKRDHFDISTITSSMMHEWQYWLEEKYGKDARAVSLYTSHISYIHKAAQKEFNSEEMDHLCIRNPFMHYTPPKPPASKHRDVSPDIIQGMINNYHLLEKQERLAVGAFLLSFGLMGLNTPDMFECEPIKNGVLHYKRIKTRGRRDDEAEMFVKVPEEIAPLIKEYSDKTKRRAFKFYLHYKNYKSMQGAESDGMELYKSRIEFEGRLTNYSARHTWATIARSAKCQIPINLIDECLDHVSAHPIADIYAKKDWSIYWDANDKVIKTFDWSPLAIHR